MKSNLNSPISLRSSDAAKRGGTNGALDGASNAALDRGYSKVREAEEAGEHPVPSSLTGGGFLGRPHGWER